MMATSSLLGESLSFESSGRLISGIVFRLLMGGEDVPLSGLVLERKTKHIIEWALFGIKDSRDMRGIVSTMD